MTYHIVIDGEFASLNEFIDACHHRSGRWNKGNSMKQRDQNTLSVFITSQLKKVHIDKPIYLKYTYYCKNKRKDKDNIAGYFHKIFQDALVNCKVIHNDNWAYIVGFSDTFEIDAATPRIEIDLEER